MRFTLAFHLFLSLFVTGLGFTQGVNDDSFSSYIVGQVVDQAGRPIAKAGVCGSAFHLDWTGMEPCSVSDRRGRFKLHIWRKGRYTVM